MRFFLKSFISIIIVLFAIIAVYVALVIGGGFGSQAITARIVSSKLKVGMSEEEVYFSLAISKSQSSKAVIEERSLVRLTTVGFCSAFWPQSEITLHFRGGKLFAAHEKIIHFTDKHNYSIPLSDG